MTQARFVLDPYTIRVLDVVKGKFGLKNREEALRRFVEEHGTEYANVSVEDGILKELDATLDRHQRKHRQRRMSVRELDKLLGL